MFLNEVIVGWVNTQRLEVIISQLVVVKLPTQHMKCMSLCKKV